MHMQHIKKNDEITGQLKMRGQISNFHQVGGDRGRGQSVHASRVTIIVHRAPTKDEGAGFKLVTMLGQPTAARVSTLAMLLVQ